MTDTLTLYTNPMSRGRIARWMMEEAGQPYAVVNTAYGPAMKSDAYRAINPMGKVPALTHNGKIVTECAAICVYMAETFPAAGLAPTADERADYYRWMFFTAGPIEQAVTNKALGFEVPTERRGMVGYGTYERALDTLETAVAAQDYIAGHRFTAADVYVGAAIAWGMMFGTVEKRPAFEAYAARVTARDAYRRALALCEAEAAEMKAAG